MASNRTTATDFGSLANNRTTRHVKFMGQDVLIQKLNLAECTEIQRYARNIDETDPEKAFDLLKMVIRTGCPIAADIDDETFAKFPMDDLNKFSDTILDYGGMTPNRK